MNEVKVATFDPFHGNFYSAGDLIVIFHSKDLEKDIEKLWHLLILLECGHGRHYERIWKSTTHVG